MSGGERRAQGTQDVEYADREEDLTADGGGRPRRRVAAFYDAGKGRPDGL